MDFDNPKREIVNIAPGHQPTRVLNGFQLQIPWKNPEKSMQFHLKKETPKWF